MRPVTPTRFGQQLLDRAIACVARLLDFLEDGALFQAHAKDDASEHDYRTEEEWNPPAVGHEVNEQHRRPGPNHALLMCFLESLCDFGRNLQNLLNGQRTFLQALSKSLAVSSVVSHK